MARGSTGATLESLEALCLKVWFAVPRMLTPWRYSAVDRLEGLKEATAQELLNELVIRRQMAVKDCSDKEIEAELKKRGVDIGHDLPKLVEK